MTGMRKMATRVGAALIVTAAGLSFTPATSSAEPATHQVRYTVTAGQDATVDLYYVTTAPADQAAFNANSNAYARSERVPVGPGAPWVFETTLTDTSWAFVRAGAAARYNGTQNPHCEIAIDGNVVLQQDGETAATCALRAW
jgi:hypothetical protein